MISPLRDIPIVCYALSGVIFCLDFNLFLFSSLVPLPSVIYLFIYLFILVRAWHKLSKAHTKLI